MYLYRLPSSLFLYKTLKFPSLLALCFFRRTLKIPYFLLSVSLQRPSTFSFSLFPYISVSLQASSHSMPCSLCLCPYSSLFLCKHHQVFFTSKPLFLHKSLKFPLLLALCFPTKTLKISLIHPI
jgi:hypothetical protein